MLTYKIHFIRHGETEDNTTGRYIGVTDVKLSAEGAQKLNDEKIFYKKPQKVYCSPLLRCTQTADILFPDTFCEKVTELTEYNYGDFEGKTIAELKNSIPYRKWIGGNAETPVPNGESGREFEKRCTEAIEYIIKDMSMLKVREAAVITHGGVIRHILTKCTKPGMRFEQWNIPFGGGYTVITDPALWMRDKVLELYDAVPSSGAEMPEADEDAYLDYAESLLDDQDLV